MRENPITLATKNLIFRHSSLVKATAFAEEIKKETSQHALTLQKYHEPKNKLRAGG